MFMQDDKQGEKKLSIRFVHLIRHAESTANIDLPTEDHFSIPLTEKGKRQSEALSQDLPGKPDLILLSSFLRAKQTAEPTIRRYPDVPVEIWPELGEFTYLSPASCKGTTRSQRIPYVKKYWDRMDPDYLDGEGAESFRQFVERTEKAYSKILQCQGENIFLFSHGQFLNCLLDIARHPDLTVKDRMVNFCSLPVLENCDLITLII